VSIAPTKKGAVPVTVDIYAALTDAERQRVEVTDCGPMWLRTWRRLAEGLQLTVEQGKAMPPLVLVVSPTGELKPRVAMTITGS